MWATVICVSNPFQSMTMHTRYACEELLKVQTTTWLMLLTYKAINYATTRFYNCNGSVIIFHYHDKRMKGLGVHMKEADRAYWLLMLS